MLCIYKSASDKDRERARVVRITKKTGKHWGAVDRARRRHRRGNVALLSANRSLHFMGGHRREHKYRPLCICRRKSDPPRSHYAHAVARGTSGLENQVEPHGRERDGDIERRDYNAAWAATRRRCTRRWFASDSSSSTSSAELVCTRMTKRRRRLFRDSEFSRINNIHAINMARGQALSSAVRASLAWPGAPEARFAIGIERTPGLDLSAHDYRGF